MGDNRFEWDDTKAAANLRKHGVSFEEAAEALRDPFSLTQDDLLHSAEKARSITLGYSERFRMVMVVHTSRGLRERIISARKATAVEERSYHLPR